MIKALVFAAFVGICVADLRMASQPKNKWKALDRNRKVPFVPDYALYMEPSDFNYAGLKNQRQKAYDNFLRSNIDNEQDRRNFNTEAGKDHLPFRSYETGATDASVTVERKLPTVENPPGLGPGITAEIGKPFLVPLRWNNPHASELEVNIWIMKRALPAGNMFNKKPVVVPIRKPTCSGEGHQDNVFKFTIPKNFNSLGALVPGFYGCRKVGDCILQIYAHSVESRTYAMGTPLIIKGDAPPAPTATSDGAIAAPGIDVGVDKAGFDALRPLCLPSSDPKADITTAAPRWPRLVSDVFNHAYQNSDFSPYSGQQPESISQNLQASAILKMTVGNRGELGKKYFAKNNAAGRNYANKLDKKARALVRLYESIANQIIGVLGHEMKNTDNGMAALKQKTETCFRCAEVGAVVARRLTTNTYVPSFAIPDKFVYNATQYIAPIYAKNLLVKRKLEPTDAKESTVFQIYNGVLQEMNAEFVQAGKYGVHYLGPMIKDTLTTMEDKTMFRKISADGKNDGGYYAASLAAKKIADNKKNVKSDTVPNHLTKSSFEQLLDNLETSFIAAQQPDMNGVMGDSNCDDDATWKEGMACQIDGTQYPRPGQLFPDVGQVERPTPSANSASSATVSLFAVFAAVMPFLF